MPKRCDPTVILDAGIEQWTQLPGSLPPGEMHETLHESDTSKALEAGLRVCPVSQTVRDTWAWLQEIGGATPEREDRPRLGLDPEVEHRLLVDERFDDAVGDLQRSE